MNPSIFANIIEQNFLKGEWDTSCLKWLKMFKALPEWNFYHDDIDDLNGKVSEPTAPCPTNVTKK